MFKLSLYKWKQVRSRKDGLQSESPDSYFQTPPGFSLSFILQILVPIPSCLRSLTGIPLVILGMMGCQSNGHIEECVPIFHCLSPCHLRWSHSDTKIFISTPVPRPQNPNYLASKILTQLCFSHAITLMTTAHPPLSHSTRSSLQVSHVLTLPVFCVYVHYTVFP